jgi:hypothetical protein
VNSAEVVEWACVACRVTAIDASKQNGYGQRYVDATHLLHLPGVYRLTPQNKIHLRVYYRENAQAFEPGASRDRVFEVLGSRVPDELAEFTMVTCREYNAGESS